MSMKLHETLETLGHWVTSFTVYLDECFIVYFPFLF